MIAKGRQRYVAPRGENQGNAILTEKTAAEALQLLDEGYSLTDVASFFGVSVSAINLLYVGRNWAHLPGKRKQPRAQMSRHEGVTWRHDRQKWEARCTINHVRRHLGAFAFEADAAVAYNYFVAYHGLDRPLNQITLEEWCHD
jgi:hypothetical protein